MTLYAFLLAACVSNKDPTANESAVGSSDRRQM
jgi:NhaP-type Na+/H+ or K+/H+ antiporter